MLDSVSGSGGAVEFFGDKIHKTLFKAH